MGNMFTSDELNQIFGTGGAVEYFKQIKSQMNTNMSAKAYAAIMEEAEVYLATRLEKYFEGTPGMQKYGPMLEKLRKKGVGMNKEMPFGLDINAIEKELNARK